jgi:hypothetical protein
MLSSRVQPLRAANLLLFLRRVLKDRPDRHEIRVTVVGPWGLYDVTHCARREGEMVLEISKR